MMWPFKRKLRYDPPDPVPDIIVLVWHLKDGRTAEYATTEPSELIHLIPLLHQRGDRIELFKSERLKFSALPRDDTRLHSTTQISEEDYWHLPEVLAYQAMLERARAITGVK